MKYAPSKNLLLIIFFLFVNLVYCQDSNPNQWIEDIDYLKTELPNKHYNLFEKQSQVYFNNEIDNIKSSSSNLSDLEIAIRLQQLVASTGDSHTLIDFNNLINKEKFSVIIKKGLTRYWNG